MRLRRMSRPSAHGSPPRALAHGCSLFSRPMAGGVAQHGTAGGTPRCTSCCCCGKWGLDPASNESRRALGLVRDRVTWQGCGPQECRSNLFFTGEVEPCINGQVAASGAYFGQDVRHIVDRLLGEQLPDGGWNCEAENGSTRSSFNTTICVLEALLEHERAVGNIPEVTEARLRGQEYFSSADSSDGGRPAR